MRGELHGHALGVGGLQEIPLHGGVSDAAAIVAGRGGEEHDGPAPHDDGDVAGRARVGRVARREAVDGDGVVGAEPVGGHGGAAEAHLLEHRGHGMDGGEGLGVLELREHLDEDGHARAVVHALAAHAMAVGELGELADEGHRVTHADPEGRHVGRAGRAHVDVHVRYRGGPGQLLR